MKKIIKCTFLLIVLTLSIGCTKVEESTEEEPKKAEQKETQPENQSAPENDKLDCLKEITYAELKQKIDKKETFIFLISQSFCSHCIAYKPVLNKVLKEYNLEAYYIEYDLLNDSKKQGVKDIFNFTGTPVTIFVIDGKEVSVTNRLSGEAKKDKIIEKLKETGFIK